MKRMKSCSSLIGALALSASAGAALAADFTDLAPVVSTAPIIERVSTPRQECRNETVSYQDNRPSSSSPVGAIIGGIAGGVLGHQVGSGRGNAVATGVGAVAGAVAGDRLANNGGVFSGDSQASPQVVQRCRTVSDMQDVVRGYNVVYRYNGRDVNVRLPYDPGSRVRVGVAVIPDSRPPAPYGAN